MKRLVGVLVAVAILCAGLLLGGTQAFAQNYAIVTTKMMPKKKCIRSGGNGVKPFLGVPMRTWPAQNSQTPTPCASVEQPARPARTWRDLEVAPADGC